MKKFLLFLALLPLAACSDDDTSDPCTTVYVPGLQVTVQEGSNIITDGITVVAVDGDYIEELVQVGSTNYYEGAHERPGTYTITVTGEGYTPYVSEPITVEADECHVITQETTITVELAE
jgi:hypothetical protein